MTNPPIAQSLRVEFVDRTKREVLRLRAELADAERLLGELTGKPELPQAVEIPAPKVTAKAPTTAPKRADAQKARPAPRPITPESCKAIAMTPMNPPGHRFKDSLGADAMVLAILAMGPTTVREMVSFVCSEGRVKQTADVADRLGKRLGAALSAAKANGHATNDKMTLKWTLVPRAER